MKTVLTGFILALTVLGCITGCDRDVRILERAGYCWYCEGTGLTAVKRAELRAGVATPTDNEDIKHLYRVMHKHGLFTLSEQEDLKQKGYIK